MSQHCDHAAVVATCDNPDFTNWPCRRCGQYLDWTLGESPVPVTLREAVEDLTGLAASREFPEGYARHLIEKRDREELEMAAKAADLKHAGWTDHYCPRFYDYDEKTGQCGLVVEQDGHTHISLWNPKEDDGDALRLAVILCLDILHCPNTVQVGMPRSGTYLHEQIVGDDRQTATRLAIFHAAVKIGRAML